MSRFKKGQSGNPKGRPKGSKNITNAEVKQLVLDVLGKEFTASKIRSDLKELKSRDRLSFFERLAKLVIPKEQEFKLDYEKLTPEQLDIIIDKIVNVD